MLLPFTPERDLAPAKKAERHLGSIALTLPPEFSQPRPPAVFSIRRFWRPTMEERLSCC